MLPARWIQMVWVRHFFGVDFGIFWVSSHWHLSHVLLVFTPHARSQKCCCSASNIFNDGKIIFRWWVIPSSRPLHPIAYGTSWSTSRSYRESATCRESPSGSFGPCTWWSVSQRCCKDMCMLRCLGHRVKNRTCSRAHFRKLGWGGAG